MQEIPLQAIPAQRLRVILSEQNCTLHVYWRFGVLYMDLLVDDVPVFTSNICQNKANIVQNVTTLFNGSLHFVDLQGDAAPQYEGLNTRWVLVFIPEGKEIPEYFRY